MSANRSARSTRRKTTRTIELPRHRPLREFPARAGRFLSTGSNLNAFFDSSASGDAGNGRESHCCSPPNNHSVAISSSSWSTKCAPIAWDAPATKPSEHPRSTISPNKAFSSETPTRSPPSAAPRAPAFSPAATPASTASSATASPTTTAKLSSPLQPVPLLLRLRQFLDLHQRRRRVELYNLTNDPLEKENRVNDPRPCAA